MLLTIGEIDTLQVYDKEYRIITNARYWINKNIELSIKENENNKVLTLFDCVIDCNVNHENIEYQKRLLEKILWFYNLEYERCSDYQDRDDSSVNNKMYDFDIDGGRIFSAFYKTYNIDIEAMLDTMHWWKFMAMFNDLSTESNFKSVYMYYRGYDKSTKEYSGMLFENKRKIDKMINKVLLTENDTTSETFTESMGYKTRLEAKEKKDKVKVN